MRRKRLANPEIYKFYEQIFRFVSRFGLLSFKLDLKTSTLISPIQGISLYLFKFNCFYMTVFLLKNVVIVLVELIPKSQIIEESEIGTGDRAVVTTLKIIWLVASLSYWIQVVVGWNYQDEWKNVLSIWIRMESCIPGKSEFSAHSRSRSRYDPRRCKYFFQCNASQLHHLYPFRL